MTTLNIPITDLESIKKLLPHREPIIMVDALLEFSDGNATVGFTVKKESLFMDDDTFSETGLIEHMAQAAALYTGYKNYGQKQAAREGYIASIKKLNIITLPKVNDALTTKVSIGYELMLMTTVKLTIFNKNIEIASAEMNLVLKEDI